MRRSISDIVAVVLLIVIAIAAAVIIYMWLSGLIGAVHSTSPALSEKVEIIGATVTTSGLQSVTVLVPQGSSAVTIVAAELLSTNGTTLCTYTVSSTTVTPTQSATISSFGSPSGSCSSLTAGMPVVVEVVTSSGITASYQTTVS